MKIFAALPLAILAAGCVSVDKAHLPDGTVGYSMSKCRNMAKCYNKAAEVCGGKYSIVDQNGSTQGAIVPMASGGVVGGFGTQYSLTVKCGAP